MGGVVALLGYKQMNSSVLVREMCKAMGTRGPDESGWFVREDIALGNVASHKDPFKQATHPLGNKNESIWICFDGELYNSAHLKNQLGYESSKMISDAELVIKIYEKKGQQCLKQLDGIFAFCIWDSLKKLFLCARDRFGVRPLYYYTISGKYIFASEIKVMFADLNIRCFPNDAMIRRFLLTGDHYQNGDTFFAKVKELLPGYYATLNLKTNTFRVKRYWNLPQVPFLTKGKNVSACKFLNIFRSTIKKMLPEEVKFAICLSGGIDSVSLASIVDELSKNSNKRDYTLISAISSSKMENERPYIEEFSRFKNAEINFVYLPISPKWKEVKDYVYHLEEPFNHFNFYLHYCVAKELKRQKIKIAFTGNGSDGFLWGFEEHRIAYLRSLWKNRDIGTFLVEIAGMLVQQDYSSLYERFNLVKMLAGILKGVFLGQKMEFGDRIRLTDRFARLLDKTYLMSRVTRLKESPMDEVTKRATKDTGALERLFSSFSVEVRHPFLDSDLAELMLLLPSNQKIRRGIKKYIIRNAMKNLIPESIRKSKRKFPTAAPFVQWLVNLHPEISEMIQSKAFRGRHMFNPEEIMRVFASLLQNKLDQGESWRFAQILWRIINVELWFETYIDPHDESSK
ncbi:asparagine synthase (glutamine-hydrolyzing), partial [Candidatus Bathyarchaeota archaeon]